MLIFLSESSLSLSRFAAPRYLPLISVKTTFRFSFPTDTLSTALRVSPPGFVLLAVFRPYLWEWIVAVHSRMHEPALCETFPAPANGHLASDGAEMDLLKPALHDLS